MNRIVDLQAIRLSVLLAALIAAVSVVVVASQQDASKAGATFLVRSASVPLYSAIALTGRFTGTVHLTVTVKAGRVTAVNSKSSADQSLVAVAVANVKTWKFDSDMHGSFETTYSFELEGDEVSTPENPRVEMQLPSLVKVIARPLRPTCTDCGGGFRRRPLK